MNATPTADRVPLRADLAAVDPYGAPQIDVAVRLNTNETPTPPPGSFLTRLGETVAALPLHRYPDRRVTALRTALGARVGLPVERVWAANGSNEVFLQLLQAYGGPGRRALVFRPGYSAHPLIAKVAATPLVEADLDDEFVLTPEVAAAAVRAHDPHVVVVASPNNPTGITVDLDAVVALHDESRALVVVDEAYVEFGGRSAVGLLDALPRLVVSRTFSKAWRMAGIRLGYLYAHDWVVNDLRKVRLPYHLDAMTQAAGLLACEMIGEVTAHVADIAVERERLRAAMSDLGVTVWPSSANFLLFRPERDGVFDALLERGVLVRDFSRQPRLEGCLRVTVGTRAEDDLFLAALADVR